MKTNNKTRLYIHEVFNEDNIVNKTDDTFKTAAYEAKHGGGIALYRSILQKYVNVNKESISKVVDENGEPLVVYHGTEEEFSVFDRTKSRTNMDIQGSFFVNVLELSFTDINYKSSTLIDSPTERTYIGNKQHKKHTNIAYWHNTVNKFKIKNDDGGYDEYFIRFTVTEQYAGKKKPKGSIGERTLHSTNISAINIQKKDSDATNTSSYLGATSPSDNIIADYFRIVNKLVNVLELSFTDINQVRID